MRGGEFSERVVSPEAFGEWVSDGVVQFPGGEESSGYHVPLGGDGVPESGDAGGTGEIRDGKLLEDEAEDVGGG